MSYSFSQFHAKRGSYEILSPTAQPCLVVIPLISTSKSHEQLYTLSTTMGEDHFPEVQGGGSLILAWQIRNKRVLVVGGGEVSR